MCEHTERRPIFHSLWLLFLCAGLLPWSGWAKPISGWMWPHAVWIKLHLVLGGMAPDPGLCITKFHQETELEGLRSSPLCHEWNFVQHMTQGRLSGLALNARALVRQRSAKVKIWRWAFPTAGHLEWCICWTGEGQRWKGEEKPRREPSRLENGNCSPSPSCDRHLLGTPPVHGAAMGVPIFKKM